jgi:phosphoribosylanthranilate isomerase
MKNLTGKFTAFAAALFLMLGFFVFADSADAQTRKKKKRKITRQTVKQTPQPVPQTTLPVVVSEAEQYSNQNQQLITGNTEIQPVQTETQTPTEIVPENETFEEKFARMNSRLNELEGSKRKSYEERQRRLLMNLDILTKAETRAESLRKQLFDLIEKENATKTKLETLEYDLRPDVIERQVAFAGSLRPEELREARRRTLEAEKRNLTTLLLDMERTRLSLEQNVQRADQMVERLRAVLEKDIDDALNEQTNESNNQ